MSNFKDLQEKYRIVAISHGENVFNGDHKAAKKQYENMKEIYGEICENKFQQTDILSELLSDENIYVISWAATHCLSLNILQHEAISILEVLSTRKDIGILSFSSAMNLKVWKESGSLEF